jgi:hypothetical protein
MRRSERRCDKQSDEGVEDESLVHSISLARFRWMREGRRGLTYSIGLRNPGAVSHNSDPMGATEGMFSESDLRATFRRPAPRSASDRQPCRWGTWMCIPVPGTSHLRAWAANIPSVCGKTEATRGSPARTPRCCGLPGCSQCRRTANGRLEPTDGSDSSPETCPSGARRGEDFERAATARLWPGLPVRGRYRQQPFGLSRANGWSSLR